MEADPRRMRGDRLYVFSNIKQEMGIELTVAFMDKAGAVGAWPTSIARFSLSDLT
jgi:hypothetical protein